MFKISNLTTIGSLVVIIVYALVAVLLFRYGHKLVNLDEKGEPKRLSDKIVTFGMLTSYILFTFIVIFVFVSMITNILIFKEQRINQFLAYQEFVPTQLEYEVISQNTLLYDGKLEFVPFAKTSLKEMNADPTVRHEVELFLSKIENSAVQFEEHPNLLLRKKDLRMNLQNEYELAVHKESYAPLQLDNKHTKYLTVGEAHEKDKAFQAIRRALHEKGFHVGGLEDITEINKDEFYLYEREIVIFTDYPLTDEEYKALLSVVREFKDNKEKFNVVLKKDKDAEEFETIRYSKLEEELQYAEY